MKHRNWKNRLLSAAVCSAAAMQGILAVPGLPVHAAPDRNAVMYLEELAGYGTNLALNKTGKSSSQEVDSLSVTNLFDGDTETKAKRWSSARGSGAEWFYVDLGSVQTVSMVRIIWEGTKADNRMVQIALDNPDTEESWTTVKDMNGWPTGNDDRIPLDEPVSARYVRLYIPSHSEAEHVSTGVEAWNTVAAYEFEVYGEMDPNYQDPQENIALSKSVFASSQEADSVRAELAVDGNTSSRDSRWGSAKRSDPEWIYVDLGKTMDVKTVRIYWENRKATSYRIETAPDGSDPQSADAWTVQKTFERPASIVDTIVLDNTIKARYVRLSIASHDSKDPDGTGDWNTVSIYEMEVYGGQPKSIASMSDMLAQITVDPPAKGDLKVNVHLPVSDSFTAEYRGTDLEQIVDSDLNIHTPLTDRQVKLAFKVTNNQTGACELKEVTTLIPGQYSASENDNPAPQILPELQEWKGNQGVFTLKDSSKIIYAQDELAAAAASLQEDGEEIYGYRLPAVKGNADQASDGDIFLTLSDSDPSLGKEGYHMIISEAVTVEAKEPAGAYWSTRTILQALKASSSSHTIPKGEARDYPLYEKRGLVLDVGRKTFSYEWLQDTVKLLSWFKLNDFQIHLMDNYIWVQDYTNKGLDPFDAYSGFRLESNIRKGGNGGKNQADLTSTDMFYTKDEFRSLIQDARNRGISIVPEIDVPAHSLALTRVRPDLRLGTNGVENDHLNLTDKYDESMEFVQSVFDEYLTGENPVFDEQTMIHIGGDEYQANSAAYRRFVNDMIDYIKGTGRTPRLWGSLKWMNQGEDVSGDGVETNLWSTDWAELKGMYDLGFDLFACNDRPMYIVPGGVGYPDYHDQSTMYNTELNRTQRKPSDYIPAGDPQFKGGAFCIWNDLCDQRNNGLSQYDIYLRMIHAAGLFAANSWGKQDASLDEAKTRAAFQSENVPGTDYSYQLPRQDGQILSLNMESTENDSQNRFNLNSAQSIEVASGGRQALYLDGTTAVSVNDLQTAGLNNSLRVKVKRAALGSGGQVLFQSDYGKIYAVMPDTGKVGIVRENCSYSFDYTLPVGQWVDLEIRNELEKTHLYVNGKKVDTAGTGKVPGYSNINYKATCMLPVGTIGDPEHSLIGWVDDIRLGDAKDTFTSTRDLEEKLETLAYVNGASDPMIQQGWTLCGQYDPSSSEISSFASQIDERLSGKTIESANPDELEQYLALVPEHLEYFTSDSVAILQNYLNTLPSDPATLNASRQQDIHLMAQALHEALMNLKLSEKSSQVLFDQKKMTATASDWQAAENNRDPGLPEYAVDGDPSTFWHTNWDTMSLPQYLQIDLGSAQTISAVLYTPRPGGGNGNVTQYELQISVDGTSYETVRTGSLAANGDVKTIALDTPKAARYIRFHVVKDQSGQNHASCAELNVQLASIAHDEAGLQQILDRAKALPEDAFTESSFGLLKTKIAQAQDILSGKEETGPIMKELELAIAQLVYQSDTASQPDLSLLIVLTNDIKDGRTENLQLPAGLSEQLSSAWQMIEHPENCTQNEVDQKTKSLHNLWLQTRRKADRKSLEQLS